MGLRRNKRTPFTRAEDEVIRSSAGRTSVDVGRELGRDPNVIRLRARKLGIGSWKEFGGGLKESGGYKISRINRSNGKVRRVPEHRDIAAKSLGRELTDYERVHHINGRKRDNDPSNLYVCESDGAHSRAHHSILGLLAPLLERGVIEFDRAEGVYRLCEIRK